MSPKPLPSFAPTSAKASVSRRSFKEGAKLREDSPAFILAACYAVFGEGVMGGTHHPLLPDNRWL